ncbi:excinuclease ABC subunit A [Candidatus Gracilibacteria bacterium HOT-871]|nr:excinuclease ABC subunit A [Candidatus Gracilibacteria bacterium HOT-871]MBB1565267.1 excinuclease ABC subunit UvrA [Candidatus Gracilibacteria bacterium]
MSKYLEVIGANTHNLKNISVKIPKNKMTVITGVSGSGKSSLAFNTIYNVGQQKYLESLSSYARMFIGGLDEEAEVNEIIGLSPTISIDQKTTSKNPRSTVGTITEIYDYYKVLYLNIGDRKCIKCGTIVKKDSISDIIDYISKFEDNRKFIIKAPFGRDFLSLNELKKEILDLGFIRFSIGDNIFTVNDELETVKLDNISIIVDRLVKKDFSSDDSADTKRLKDSINLAYKVGNGQLEIVFLTENKNKKDEKQRFSNIFVCSNCGHIPAELSISSFSFNSHAGACPDCHGLGVRKVFLEEKVINSNLTLLEGAIVGPGFGGDYFFEFLKEVGKKNRINLNKKYSDLTKREKDLILYGTGDKKYEVHFKTESGAKRTFTSKYEGVINTLTRRYYDGGADKGIYDEYVLDMDCPVCNGYRLNQESLSVYINGLNIGQLSDLSVSNSIKFFKEIKLTKSEEKISKKALKNIIERLEFLAGVGLDYITISRKAGTISGGESQRIRLATQLGTKLEGIIYILDEPSIGLHPRDNDMLIENLKKLRDLGNTLIIVEHDEDIMRESDYIIDIGPGAGIHGGEVVAEGTIDDIINNPNSITGPYLSRKKDIFIKRGKRENYLDLRKKGKELKIIGAKEHNLKNINVSIPLENFVVVTGVSGSGKSSLINDILANYLANELNRAKRESGQFKEILGLENLDKTVIIDQSPIGRTPRSNPATYTGVFTPIREIFAMTEEAQIRGYGPGRFSFNTRSGRCEACEGDGLRKIEMHFLPTVYVECEVCSGKRYNTETLKIKYKGKTISDVLDMTIEEAIKFFKNHPKVVKILNVLDEVGLGYVKLGQSSTTLSGGESQRVKLATELSKRSTTKTFYILDEPTTGLHFQDVTKLLKILHSLVDKGNTVLVIEHNMDVILNADHLIDIGPDGGDRGGNLVYEGGIEGIQKCKESFTGQAIKKYLGK